MKVVHGDIYGVKHHSGRLNSTLINAKLSLCPPCSHPHFPLCFLREKEGLAFQFLCLEMPGPGHTWAVGPACGSFLEWWQMVEGLWQITKREEILQDPGWGGVCFRVRSSSHTLVSSARYWEHRGQLCSDLTGALKKPLFFWVSPSFTWMWLLMQMQTENGEVPPSCATSTVSACESPVLGSLAHWQSV